MFGSTQEPRKGKRELSVQVKSVVLQGCAGQHQPLACFEEPGGLVALGVGVLNGLRFIQYDNIEGLFFQKSNIRKQSAVGGQDNMVIADMDLVGFPVKAI